jgi:hypothetical protein
MVCVVPPARPRVTPPPTPDCEKVPTMRTRSLKLGAIGASIGLVLLASAVSPASAAPSVSTALNSPTSCSAFAGGTATGSSFAASAVSLRAGETITATVSPAREGDNIWLSSATGFLSITTFQAPASRGLTFQAPATGTYGLTWTLRTTTTMPSTVTWSFTSKCSSTTVTPTPTPTPTATTKPGKGKGK